MSEPAGLLSSIHRDSMMLTLPTLSSAVNTLQLFAEPTRVRLMALLAEEELTVAELVHITEIGQSSVSTHLARLRDAGLLRDRRVGASTLYALNDGNMPAEARRVWSLVADEVKDAVLDGDRDRCADVLKSRTGSVPWPDSVAGQMDRHYSPGRTWESIARGLFGLMHLGDVLDLGSGDGAIAQLVAPRARSVTCLDRNPKMVEAAHARLAETKNATVQLGDMHELAFSDASFDIVMMFNVLTQATAPARVLSEAARVLRKHGSLSLVTLGAHDETETTASYGDIQPGFTPSQLRRILQKAGLTVDACDVACREKRQPHFEVIAAFAHKNPQS
jgi:ubiquinone/menaquinone biosynthesis C-methylase UbiE/DNA-binding transcriptional ArsR family regulator